MNALFELFLVVVLFTLAGGFLGQYFTHSPLLAIPSGLACGALAYLTYRWREVVAAVQKSWRRNTDPKLWETRRQKAKIRAMFAFADALGMSSPGAMILGFFFLISGPTDKGAAFYLQSGGVIAIASMGLPFLLSFLLGPGRHTRTYFTLDEQYAEARVWIGIGHRNALWMTLGVYPIRLIIWIGKQVFTADYPGIARTIGRGLVVAWKACVGFGAWFIRFAWNVVVMIHSKKRLIAGTTTLVFATAAYFAENVSLATALALLAGATSVVLHELVAKRVIGVIPNGSRVAR